MGARLHIVELDEEFASRDLVALLHVDGSDGGCDGAGYRVVHHGLHAAVGADVVDNNLAAHTGFTHRNALPRKGARYEVHDDDDDDRAQPKPEPTRLLSFFSHSPNQGQYIGLRKRSEEAGICLRNGFKLLLEQVLAGIDWAR